MYAENRGADSARDRPPEMMIPTGSSFATFVLLYFIYTRKEGRPRNGRGRPPQGTCDASRAQFRNAFNGNALWIPSPVRMSGIVSH